jgi:branched-chain amino acid transport system permease protein
MFGYEISPYYARILLDAGINIILVLSLNLVNGFTGQFSMGHAGFMAIGGYVSAFLAMTFLAAFPSLFAISGMNLLLFAGCLVSAGLVAAIAGYFVGLPSLRLKGDYLAIVTLGFGEIIRVVFLNIEKLGGARGLPGIPNWSSWWMIFGIALITWFVISRLTRASFGRAILSIRENEIAAESMGVPVTEYKVKAFVLGAFFAGIAGALFAHHQTIITPQQFDFNKSFEIIIMVVLGGMGSLAGSVVAAFFLTILKEALRSLQDITHLDLRMVIYSLLLIILMLVRPQGLFGKKSRSS